jgi:hypothetical protein
MQSALAALHSMSTALGYELSGSDVLDAHRLATEAGHAAHQIDQAQAVIEQVLTRDRPTAQCMRRSLGMAGPPTPVRQATPRSQ